MKGEILLNHDPKKSGRPPDNHDGDNKQPRTILMLIVAALIFTIFINSVYEDIANSQYQEITYDQFTELLSQDQLAEVDAWARSEARDFLKACAK